MSILTMGSETFFVPPSDPALIAATAIQQDIDVFPAPESVTGRQGHRWGSPAARQLPGTARRCPAVPGAGLGIATLVNWGSEATLAVFICSGTPPKIESLLVRNRQ